MSSDIQFGLKVSYDGKSVAAGATANAAQIKAIGATAEVAGAQASRSLDRTGISAKQTAAALRGVPAQFTDIFTSIAAGQNPMQVMLQQGGQLKDMFGGVGPAARALGGYIAGMVNPFTIAAAAAAGLAYVYHEGSKESDAYTRALILSGNAAGTTAAQMADAARRVATATGGTQGAAAEALALGVSGGVPGAALAGVAEAAVRMQQVTGRAIDDTVAEFAKLARDPVAASVKLNEQYNYLTEATYRQIKAFEEQGRHTDAVALAMNAYAEAVAGRTGEITANLGLIEGKWLGLKAVTKGALDALFDIGRPGDALEAAVDKVQEIQARMREVKKNAAYDPGTARAELVTLEQQLVVARANMVLVRDKANAGAVAARAEAERAARTKAALEFDKDGLKYLSRRKQMENEINDQRALGIAAGRSEEEIQKRILAIREKYTDKKPKPIDVFGSGSFVTKDKDTAQSIRDSFEFENWAQRELLKDEARGKDEAAAASKAYAEALEREIGPINARARALATERQNAGKTAIEINDLAIARVLEKRAIDAGVDASELSLARYDAQVAALRRVGDELEKNRAAQADWLAGAKAGLEDYAKSTEDKAGQTRRAWSSTWKRAEDDLSSALAGGKVNIGDFVRYAITEFNRIAIVQPAMKSLGNASSGLLGKLMDGVFNMSSSSAETTAMSAWAALPSAKGNVFNSPDLHRYVNTVVDRPTRFRFAKGGALGEMGEAGPEAIMPLKRGKDGSLGVVVQGGAGTTSMTFNTSISIDARGAGAGVGPIIERAMEMAVAKAKSDVMRDLEGGGRFAYASGRRR